METSSPSIPWLVVLPVLVAAGYFASAVVDLRRDLALERHGVAATATVAGFTRQYGRCGHWCTTVIYDYAAAGTARQGQHTIPDGLHAALLRGAALEVAYDPRDPARAEPLGTIEHEKGRALLRLALLPGAVLVSVIASRKRRSAAAAGSG